MPSWRGAQLNHRDNFTLPLLLSAVERSARGEVEMKKKWKGADRRRESSKLVVVVKTRYVSVMYFHCTLMVV
jgi:hypothetical protein